MKSVHIVGGGASLINFNWDSLRGLDVITVNDAFKQLPDAKIVFFWNAPWFEKNRSAYLAHKGQHIRGCHLDQVGECHKYPQIETYWFTGINGLELQAQRLRHGNNAGYAAINLAVQLGYKEIFLHGFDMQTVGGRAHYHNDALRVDEPITYQIMARNFATMNPQLRTLKVSVFNCSLDSVLGCFPKVAWPALNLTHGANFEKIPSVDRLGA